MAMAEHPNPGPGSAAALALGCKCPVLDNAYGAGVGLPGPNVEQQFWINGHCPLHGSDRTEEEQ
jgi:hypothetical protein